MKQAQVFYSCGKLLITGEYFILDGSRGLALPTRFGQRLEVSTSPATTLQIHWQSFDWQQRCWLELVLDVSCFSEEYLPENNETGRLIELLRAARRLNPQFLSRNESIAVRSFLEFPADWGLGSSSTLIHNIASWADVNPFALLDLTFGGSGYDIAVAQAGTPVVFYRKNGLPHIQKVVFKPPFQDQLYFVHLNRKQDSREGIARYQQLSSDKSTIINRLNSLTQILLTTRVLSDFEQILMMHEDIISESIQLPKVKDTYFSDYWGMVKSLGAWGGDFVLASSSRTKDETYYYFHQKGYTTILPYQEMIRS